MCGGFEQKQHGILFCLRHSFRTSRYYEGETLEMLPYMERFLHHPGWRLQLGKKIFTSAPSLPPALTLKWRTQF